MFYTSGSPYEGPDRYPYRLNMLSEALILFVFACIGFTLYFLSGRSAIPFFVLYIPSFYLSILFIGHILPLYKNNFMTCSYQVFKVFPNHPSIKSANYYLMKLQSLHAQVDHIEDVPPLLIQALIDHDYSHPENTIVLQLLILKAEHLFARNEKAAAQDCYKTILNASVLPELKLVAQFCLLLSELTGECRKDEIEALFDADLIKSTIMTSSIPTAKRLLYGYYLLHENNEAAAQEELRAFIKVISAYPEFIIVTDERDGIHEIEMKYYGRIVTEREKINISNL